MFNKEFFPTPKDLIRKMVKPYLFDDGYSYCMKNFRILEPSAGKGDILDFLYDKCDIRRDQMFCIEKQPELQMILKEKHYQLIDSDFLEYSGDYDFNFIIMNPPFSNGDEHLLKAWDIMENGDIVCLLNAETIKNPYTERRKLLKSIIDEHGLVEYLDQAFHGADRETNVEVALVRLTKETKNSRFKFNEGFDQEKMDFDESILKDELATRDLLENIVRQYEEVKEDTQQMFKLLDKIDSRTKSLTSEYFSIYKLVDRGGAEGYGIFLTELKMQIWNMVVRRMNIEKYMTKNLNRDFNSYLRQQGNMAITKKNIEEFILMVFQNRGTILERVIEEVFDIFTKYYKENRCHVEGWKTNDSWKVNRKIILP